MGTREQIKNGLEAGKTLTVVDALNQYRTIDLRKYISDLRKEGMVINDRWVTKNGKRYKEYFVSKSYDFSLCFKK